MYGTINQEVVSFVDIVSQNIMYFESIFNQIFNPLIDSVKNEVQWIVIL